MFLANMTFSGLGGNCVYTLIIDLNDRNLETGMLVAEESAMRLFILTIAITLPLGVLIVATTVAPLAAQEASSAQAQKKDAMARELRRDTYPGQGDARRSRHGGAGPAIWIGDVGNVIDGIGVIQRPPGTPSKQ